MIVLQTTYDYWLLLRNFEPVLVWNFYGDCQTDYLRLPAFAAKLCNGSGVKLLRWLPDRLTTTTGFCCETLYHFWCETFTVIARPTNHDYWHLLRHFAPVLVWNFYGDCLTDYLRLLGLASRLCTSSCVKLLLCCLTDYLRLVAFASKLCTCSAVKLLRWLLHGPLTTNGFCCETLHQFWCETFTVIAWLTT